MVLSDVFWASIINYDKDWTGNCQSELLSSSPGNGKERVKYFLSFPASTCNSEVCSKMNFVEFFPRVKLIRICHKVRQLEKIHVLCILDIHRCFFILPGDLSCTELKGVLWKLYKISNLTFLPGGQYLMRVFIVLHFFEIIL